MKKIITLSLCVALAMTMFAGCAKESASDKNVKTADIWAKIEETLGADNLPSFMDADATALTTLFGIDAADLEEYVSKSPMINVQADEFFIAKVKEGKMDAVKAGIEKRKTDLDNTWKQYLPDVYELVQNSKTIENGNYIMFVVSPDADKAETIFNDLTK